VSRPIPPGKIATVNDIAVTVIGQDRPGIIADVTEILARLGLNLTDSTMTRLRGHFAMTLFCTAERADPAEVERALEPITEDRTLVVTVRPVADDAGPEAAGHHYVLTVHGADRLGIVATLTRVVAEAGGNITDLSTRLAGDLYVVVAELDVPSTVDGTGLAGALRNAAQTLGVEATLRPAEADLL
jgi:glycine cleavage system transcriptional repressor